MLPHRNNEIRTALGDYWGQTELDPGVEINKKYFANIENALQKTKTDIENAWQNAKTDLYAFIDKCRSSL